MDNYIGSLDQYLIDNDDCISNLHVNFETYDIPKLNEDILLNDEPF